MDFLITFKEQLVSVFTNHYFLCFMAGFLTAVIAQTAEKYFTAPRD